CGTDSCCSSSSGEVLIPGDMPLHDGTGQGSDVEQRKEVGLRVPLLCHFRIVEGARVGLLVRVVLLGYRPGRRPAVIGQLVTRYAPSAGLGGFVPGHCLYSTSSICLHNSTSTSLSAATSVGP